MHDLRDAGPSCGAKAVNLARLIAAGLPVPPGFVLDEEAFRMVAGELDTSDPEAIGHVFETAAKRLADVTIPEELERELADRIDELGPLVVVRSSALLEDGRGGGAPGVFASQRAVPIAEVWSAIRAVWTSALAPLAVAYARRIGEAPVPAIAVIVQRQVEGELLTVYTHDPIAPARDELVVQRGDKLARVSRALIPHDIANQHAVLQALRAERALDSATGVDVELVQSESQHDDVHVIETWVVQARPIVRSARVAPQPPPPIVIAPLHDGRTWTWDVAHNPDPLSPAQCGLVERVERAELGEYALRVCAGYLYTSPRAEHPLVDTRDIALAAHTIESECARILAAEPASLEAAISSYLAFYRVWANELAPLIAAARTQERGFARRPSSVEATLAAAARGELDAAQVTARLGDLAPTWDVAVAPFRERPEVLREAIARARATDAPRGAASVPHERDADALVAELVADLAERDDLLFARAQGLVRRALLARGTELGLAGDDVFWLPLDEVASGPAIDPESAHRRAGAARAAAARAAKWRMPLVVGQPPLDELARGTGTNEIAQASEVLRGAGAGPRIVGSVVRFASLAQAAFVGPADVVVVRAATPALAVFVGRCAALVSETGGLLDHGAAMARELGITCVVGCRDAWSMLSDGMRVNVDGDAGTVTIIDAIVDEK